MFTAEWFSDTAEHEFHPADLDEYQWCTGTFFHDFVRPRHHLWINAGGESEVYVRMVWGTQTARELHQRLHLHFNGERLKIFPGRITFDGQVSSDFEDFSERAKDLIAEADEAFGLVNIMHNQSENLWTHFTLSALERWRRDDLKSREAELALAAVNKQVVDYARAAKSIAKHAPQEYIELENERTASLRAEYILQKELAEKLCTTADKCQAAAQNAKSKAVEAVIECFHRYPNAPLPISLEGAELMQSSGSRLEF